MSHSRQRSPRGWTVLPEQPRCWRLPGDPGSRADPAGTWQEVPTPPAALWGRPTAGARPASAPGASYLRIKINRNLINHTFILVCRLNLAPSTGVWDWQNELKEKSGTRGCGEHCGAGAPAGPLGRAGHRAPGTTGRGAKRARAFVREETAAVGRTSAIDAARYCSLHQNTKEKAGCSQPVPAPQHGCGQHSGSSPV